MIELKCGDCLKLIKDIPNEMYSGEGIEGITFLNNLYRGKEKKQK